MKKQPNQILNMLFSFNNLQARIIFLNVTGSSRWPMKEESFAIVLNVKQYFFQSSADRDILYFSDELENRHWTRVIDVS